MQYRTLGCSGTVVSTQTLGTMTFGAEADEATSGTILTAFVEAGGTLVDTADVYSAGVSEEIIGRWLARAPRPTPRGWSLATKGRFPMGTGPTTSACRAGTCGTRSTRRCAGSGSTTSTSTRCTPGTR